MAVDFDELERLLPLLRKNGVSRFKTDGYELALGADAGAEGGAVLAPKKYVEASPTAVTLPDEKPPSDDELLFWSTGYSPDAEREAADKARAVDPMP